LRFHGAWWCGCGPGGTMGRCGCRGGRAVQPHQSCGFTAGGGRGCRSAWAAGRARVATSRQPHKSWLFAQVAGLVQQELRFHGSRTRIDWPCASSVSQDAEPGAAPDPAASFVSCRFPSVRIAGCGLGRAGELDRSAVRAMRFARVATSRQAVNVAGVAVSRPVVVWLRRAAGGWSR
jgi:hypothetical protein